MKNNNLSIKELLDLADSGATITPEEFRSTLQYFLKNVAPYIVKIDETVRDTEYGELEVKMTVRAGTVEKMMFWKGDSWMRQNRG